MHAKGAGTPNTVEPDGFAEIDGTTMYRIAAVHRLPPFLMSIVSDSDLWMYLSSTGALTAGRIAEDGAIFPYETDDKLHLSRGITGPVTLIRVTRGRDTQIWEPFATERTSQRSTGNLFKSTLSNRVVFEERNDDLGLTFRYEWAACETFGWVRSCKLSIKAGGVPAEIELLDGLLNILPAGAELAVQQKASCLINAYTQCELDQATTLAVYAMSSRITDRAEPAEALFANVAWTCGLPDASVSLSRDDISGFRAGTAATGVPLLRGERGAYLVRSRFRLKAGESRSWNVVVDANLDQAAVVRLQKRLAWEKGIDARLRDATRAARDRLNQLVAAADAEQFTADERASRHHAVNVLFNCMRGGIFANGYLVTREDFEKFLDERNKLVHAQHRAFIQTFPLQFTHASLLDSAAKENDANLLRLCHEYLPLSFSRRHGDPSRPWNRFEIRVKNEDGSPALRYQGNWRDVFQNWEALLVSFPRYIESVIAKFLNASTIDGFNPYRVTHEGIEWEVPDPNDPWSNIGYWGDHQIVYLLRLMEWSRRFHPKALPAMLCQSIFSYADVPYRLKPYEEIANDPRQTITFDAAAHRRAMERVEQIGGDGKLRVDGEGRILHVNMVEKLLVTLLSKLSNLVPGGGIWMNTQRPEWNDANNALVGSGASVVTVCYLRRFIRLFRELLDETANAAFEVSRSVSDWMHGVSKILHAETPHGMDGPRRRTIIDALGRRFCAYRKEVYANGSNSRVAVQRDSIATLLDAAIDHIEATLRASVRSDGLYHAYNLLKPSSNVLSVAHLQEMLEGQVAAISSGMLSPREVSALVDALFKSELYRPDQQSFTLYPARAPAAFLERNRVPPERVERNELLRALHASGDQRIIARDDAGVFRFNARFRNASDLSAALERVANDERWREPTSRCRREILDIYEGVFQHTAFTGRSSSMFSYEGVSCIYWHMVAKLMLAVQECCFRAHWAGEDRGVIETLAQQYYRIRLGLGFNKSAAAYGAFPLDPYSHTPLHGGAKQPGMNGQVKEEILTRLGEFGVLIDRGEIRFDPLLLRRSEFLVQACDWSYFAADGTRQTRRLSPGSLGFTFCQTPIVYSLSASRGIRLLVGGTRHEMKELTLTAELSEELFARSGRVKLIEVDLPSDLMLLQ